MIREIICRIFGHKWVPLEFVGIYCYKCKIVYSDWQRQSREMMK